MNSLDMIRDALLTVTDKVFHYEAFEVDGNYIVWAEDTQANSVWADNKMQSQAIQGTIDYFTRMENDPNFQRIQAALDGIPISYGLNSIQYEGKAGNAVTAIREATHFIHYEWVWEIWL